MQTGRKSPNLRNVAFILLVAVSGCEDLSETTTAAGPTTTLRLDTDGTGDLLYCDSDGCQTLPNPEGCVVLTIEIDLDTIRSIAPNVLSFFMGLSR